MFYYAEDSINVCRLEERYMTHSNSKHYKYECINNNINSIKL